MGMQDGYAAGKCNEDMQYGHAEWTANMDMLHGDMDMEHGHVAWTCRMDMQQRIATSICSMEM
jgi:hypothetical protein